MQYSTPVSMAQRANSEISGPRGTLLALLDGAAFATAVMPWGKPGPIRWPDDPDERAALIDAHTRGQPADVLYSPAHRPAERIRVNALALAAFCPAADGLCRWIGVDLDAADGHGAGGLIDPAHAARCFAERADAAGLYDGLLAARSRGGRGMHVFLILPDPTPLVDAVLGAAAWAAAAFKVAARDVEDYGADHAFRCANGAIAKPGQAGAVELLPRSTTKPAHGWPLALPAAGLYAPRGGGLIVDPFTDKPISLSDAAPRCDAAHWRRFLADARAALPCAEPAKPHSRPVAQPNRRTGGVGNPLDRINSKTRDFLDGRAPQGTRNVSAFAAACNLLAVGVDPADAERLILQGAAACGLPAHEARAAVASAVGAFRRKGLR